MTTNAIVPVKERSERLSPILTLNDFRLGSFEPTDVVKLCIYDSSLHTLGNVAESFYSLYVSKWCSIYYPINEFCGYKTHWLEYRILLQNKNANTQSLINSIALIDDIADDLKLTMIQTVLDYRTKLLRTVIRVSTPFGDMQRNGKETKQTALS